MMDSQASFTRADAAPSRARDLHVLVLLPTLPRPHCVKFCSGASAVDLSRWSDSPFPMFDPDIAADSVGFRYGFARSPPAAHSSTALLNCPVS